MLEVVIIKNPEQKREIFLKEDHLNSSWIVSDLTSKLAFQKELFKDQKIIADESLLRAHELWIKFIQRLRGDLKIISQETAHLFTKRLLQGSDEEWIQRPGVVALAHQYLQALMPILSHSDNFDAVKSFFQKNPESFQKWGHWYLLCHKIYQAFLDEKMILPTWASSILINEVGFEVAWDKKITFDLGAQMQPLESELILHLAKFLDVQVLVPQPHFAASYARALKNYEPFLDKNNKTIAVESEQSLSKHVMFYKYSTQLSEVQDLCCELRDWIENKKVKPEQIAIAAPDIGVYWTAIYEYLKVEGIPYQRKVQTPLRAFPEISHWLSLLKIESGQIDFSNLQMSVYTDAISANESDFKKFEQFQSEFANIYNIKDLERDSLVRSKFSLKKQDKDLSISEFFQWATKFWNPAWPQERLETLIEKVYSDVPGKIYANLEEWIGLLEKFSARIESTLDGGLTEGVHCVDLISLKDLDVSHALILGLTDQALRPSNATLISEKDIFQLRNDLGYVIAETERTDLEFDVLWNLENKKNTYILSYPQTDFDGAQMSPSVVWLKGAYLQNNKNEKIPLNNPRNSRWAQLQRSDPKKLLEQKTFSENRKESILQRLQLDSGEISETLSLEAKDLKLSASQIEDYLKCPFVLASKKLFSLNNLPELDLDIDAQTRGRLLHRVAELISEKYPALNIEDKDLDVLFDLAQKDQDFKVYDSELWKMQKNRFKIMIQKYIRFEQSWRNEFPKMVEQYPEKSFQIYIDSKTGELTTKKTDVLLRGRIDRIDVSEDKEHCVVIDYKFNSDQKKSHSSWIENNELQLALYSLAIESGTLDKKMTVSGAIYYGFKDLDRYKGFLLEGFEGEFYKFKSTRSKERITDIKKEELYKGLKNTLVTTIERMKAFDYRPEPIDQKNCKTCHWSAICRAPHLSQ